MKKVLLPYEVTRGFPPSYVYTEGSYSGHLNDLLWGSLFSRPFDAQGHLDYPLDHRASGFVKAGTISIGAAYSFVEPFAGANAHRTP